MKTETYQWLDDDTLRGDHIAVGLCRDNNVVNGAALMITCETPPGYPDVQMSVVLNAEELDNTIEGLELCRKVLRGELPVPGGA